MPRKISSCALLHGGGDLLHARGALTGRQHFAHEHEGDEQGEYGDDSDDDDDDSESDYSEHSENESSDDNDEGDCSKRHHHDDIELSPYIPPRRSERLAENRARCNSPLLVVRLKFE